MENDEHLSHIVTQWTVVFNAHRAKDATITAAQAMLLQRYAGAIYRYVLAAVRDPNAADDLAQDFALGMCKGYFKNADPNKGRFRDYVKTSLAHLIAKHFQRQKKQPLGMDENVSEPAVAAEETPAGDDTFEKNWRQELLNRAWEGLAEVERSTGQLFHTFLEHRTRNPQTSSARMAEEFGKKLGKRLTAESVRQTLHRARQRFAELLLEEVAHTVESRQRDVLEQELLDLGLYEYCKDALLRWR
jgi:RNA polymerase sigma factor (sigma-70 family)